MVQPYRLPELGGSGFFTVFLTNPGVTQRLPLRSRLLEKIAMYTFSQQIFTAEAQPKAKREHLLAYLKRFF
jgi:hypothetical protein